ncbi:alpha/beta-hydrolase [Beauveria brongniartii RCEF 3172]|uniref:Alpha/beta-hydrolase n=1 Tax=Beauveria brongniartii RCEF 3172 TaxID=1081107 RepID=A0A166WEV1_9HYPO|nr:alpha/beta-hydrolase [Beauveria brongniartii RCEF 3172]
MPLKRAQAATNKQKGESLARRTTFYVNNEWEAGSGPHDCTHIRGQMYVECLEPQRMTQDWPIILVHGDYHSSQIWLTKPDGDPGWASYFVGKGFRVYLVDLPGTGKSNNLTKEEIEVAEIRSIKGSRIERGFTAPEVFNHIADRRWSTVQKHDKWPGTGRKDDGNFDRYCASLTSLFFTIEQRQTLAQNALRCLLKTIKKAVLIGEGTGATASWLAADVVPEFVVGVVAIEPPGPPFCDGTVSRNGKRRFDSFTKFNPDRLKYGLSTIPLTYDPPVRAELELRKEPTELLPSSYPKESAGLHPLDLAIFVRQDTGKSMVLQYSPDSIPAGFIFKEKLTHGEGTMRVRKLANLAQMRHVIITGEASSHSEYDGSTMHFMQQAGLTVDCGFLERYRTYGNGHLMFLEENSDEVAAHIMRWIQNRAGKVYKPVVAAETDVTIVPEPTALLSRRAIECDQRHVRSSKRYKSDTTDRSKLSLVSAGHSNVIDLTDEFDCGVEYCSNDAWHSAYDEEYALSPASGMVFRHSTMLPPAPPPQASLPRASARAETPPVANNFEPNARESYPQRSELFVPPTFATQDPASFAFSRPTPVQSHPQPGALEKNEPSGTGRQDSQGLQPDQADFHTPPEYPTRSPVFASPRNNSACQAIYEQQKSSKRDEITYVGESAPTGPFNSFENLYTEYEFGFSPPQAMSRNGCQTTGLPDFTRMPLIPFSHDITPNTASWPQNPYLWSTQGGCFPGSFAQAPRSMPNFQPRNNAGTNAESTGATNDWFLNNLPNDLNIDLSSQNEDHLDQYEYEV